jgi:hypothetical protein
MSPGSTAQARSRRRIIERLDVAQVHADNRAALHVSRGAVAKTLKETKNHDAGEADDERAHGEPDRSPDAC